MGKTMAWLSGVSFGVFFLSVAVYQNTVVIGASLVLGILFGYISKISKNKKEVK